MQEVTVTKVGEYLWDTVLVKDDVIKVTRTKQHKGTNGHSGKTYSRFSEQEATILSLKSGKPRVYRKSYVAPNGRRRAYLYDATSEAVARSSPQTTRGTLNSGILQRFGVSADDYFKAQFPMASRFDPARGLTMHLMAEDPQALSRSLFGRHHTKAIGHALQGVSDFRSPRDASVVATFGMSLAGYVPTDWIPEAIRIEARDATAYLGFHQVRGMRRLFRRLSQDQIKRLVLSDRTGGIGENQMIRDSATQLNQILTIDPSYRLDTQGQKFKTFREVHDVLARDRRRLGEAKRSIKYEGDAAKLAGSYDGFEVVAPESTHDVLDWGNTMNNCIAAYANSAVAGHVALYGVTQGGALIGNLEIIPSTGELRQALGKHNGHLDPDVLTGVKEAVKGVWPKANVEMGWF